MSVCRLCLKKDESALNIFASDMSITIPMRIVSLTSLEIAPNDGLPQRICSQCRLQLEEFHYFRKRCYASNRRLQIHRKCTKQGTQSNLFSGTDVIDENDDDNADDDNPNFVQTSDAEDHAKWRNEALKTLRAELEAQNREHIIKYKRNLREMVEQEIRFEIEEIVYRDYKKQCRIQVLDEFFLEIEEYFIQKRNEANNDQFNEDNCVDVTSEVWNANSSEGDCNLTAVEGVHNPTTTLGGCHPFNTDCVMDLTEINSDSSGNEDENTVKVTVEPNRVENIKRETISTTNISTSQCENDLTTNEMPTTNGNRPPMVVINMKDSQSLRRNSNDDYLDNLIRSACQSHKHKVHHNKSKIGRPKKGTTPKLSTNKTNLVTRTKAESVVCRKHNNNKFRSFRYTRTLQAIQKVSNSCVRCKLRGSQTN